MKILLKLCRLWDREPSNHSYGTPFDAVADRLVGGKTGWSSPREIESVKPRGTVGGTSISIELNEDGPLLQFIVQHLDQIPNLVSAVSGAISAWAAVRALRQSKLPRDDYNGKSNTSIQIEGLRVELDRTATPEEIAVIMGAAASASFNLKKITANAMPTVSDATESKVSPSSTTAAMKRAAVDALLRKRKQLKGR